MGLMNEYLKRNLSVDDLQNELLLLISKYNEYRGTYLYLFAAACNKPIREASLEQEDYYVIHDMITGDTHGKKLDFFIETPGGSGETAEEIVKFLRSQFDVISFVVSGEAKSAGTIIVLSGDNILMTETGSLGPIDAQMRIGRSICSAFDYVDWVQKKHDEAEKTGKLNPVDATIIAQITPGELLNTLNALEYAKDMVKKWLVQYKFRNWNETKTRKIKVDEVYRKKRAAEIARMLTDRGTWRTHGRSLKIDDLENKIGLEIVNVDKDAILSDLVYRIQTIYRLLFNQSNIFKIYATDKNKIIRLATPPGNLPRAPQQQLDIVEIGQVCPKCGKTHKIFGKLSQLPGMDQKMVERGFTPFPKNAILKCDCGFEIDLSGIKNQIELETKKKIITEGDKPDGTKNGR